MELIQLKRNKDTFSNTAVVANGVVFDSGEVVLKWIHTDDIDGTINIYENMGEVKRVHEQDGCILILKDSANEKM